MVQVFDCQRDKRKNISWKQGFYCPTRYECFCLMIEMNWMEPFLIRSFWKLHTIVFYKDHLKTLVAPFILSLFHSFVDSSIGSFVASFLRSHIHSVIHSCMLFQIHKYIHTDTSFTCIHACMHTYVHTHIHAYMYTCIHIWGRYIHPYIHTYRHPSIHTVKSLECLNWPFCPPSSMRNPRKKCV